MLRKLIVLLLISSSQFPGIAQSDLIRQQLELKELREKIMKSRDDAEKLEMNRRFGQLMEELAQEPSYYPSNFDSIPKIGVIFSPNKDLKIINWNVALEDLSFLYYGMLIQKEKSDVRIKVLQDKSSKIENPLNAELSPQRWFGALYYDILPFKQEGKKKYLLLGWDGEDAFSNKKVIDVLSIDEDQARFGSTSFGAPYEKQKRIIFQYSAKSVMSMSYHEKLKMVVFDHLTPLQENLEGMHEFYVPDMSYDGLKFKGGKWNLVEDVDVRSERGMKNYNAPPKMGR